MTALDELTFAPLDELEAATPAEDEAATSAEDEAVELLDFSTTISAPSLPLVSVTETLNSTCFPL